MWIPKLYRIKYYIYSYQNSWDQNIWYKFRKKLGQSKGLYQFELYICGVCNCQVHTYTHSYIRSYLMPFEMPRFHVEILLESIPTTYWTRAEDASTTRVDVLQTRFSRAASAHIYKAATVCINTNTRSWNARHVQGSFKEKQNLSRFLKIEYN